MQLRHVSSWHRISTRNFKLCVFYSVLVLASYLCVKSKHTYARTTTPIPAGDFEEFQRRFIHADLEPSYATRVSVDGWDEAFINFFSGSAYIPLTEVVIEAVHAFSDRPILVYVAGTTSIPARWRKKYERLVVYRMPATTMHPWFDKLRVILLSPVQKGVILEADTIISPSANNLFTVLDDLLSQNVLQLLAPEHPDTRPQHLRDCKYNCYECCINPFNYPTEGRNGQYRHAHLMWTRPAKAFIRDVLKMCIDGSETDDPYHDCTSDEAAVNLAMWKSEIPVRALCMQDPDSSFWEELYFSEDRPSAASRIQKQLGQRTIAFNFCHGLKDARLARRMLRKLAKLFKDKKLTPWILHNGSLSALPPSRPHGLTGNACILS